MAVPTFCSVCDRTVYVGDNDDFACPVCSSPLPEPAQAVDIRAAHLTDYYLG